jgi:RNA polymerase-binding transcription factor DksA
MTATATRRTKRGPAQRQVDLSGPRELLQGLYLELSAEIDEASALAATVADGAEQFVGDEGDTGLLTSQREQSITVLATIRSRREQVERALERVEAGTYGICETCGQQIAAERLEASPAVTECIACRRNSERRH